MKYFSLLLALALLVSACGDKAASTNGGNGKPDPQSSESSADGLPQAQPSGRYRKGDQLYCYAYSGLVLRDQAAQTGAKLASVAMYEPVEVIDDAPFTTAFQTKESCGLPIPGHWVQVRHKGKEGWLFDGYLLGYPPKVEISDTDYWNQQSKSKSYDHKEGKEDDEILETTDAEWVNGILMSSMVSIGGSDNTTTYPPSVMSFEQAYLFAIASDPKNEFQQGWNCTCQSAQKKIECRSKDQYGQIEISQDADGNTVVKEGWAE